MDARVEQAAATGQPVAWQQRTGTIVGVAALACVWVVQYGAIVPTVLLLMACGWLLRAVGKVGGVGFLLLFLPIIGWIILAVMVSHRHGQREIAQAIRDAHGVTQAPAPTNRMAPLLRPWGAAWLRTRTA